MIAGEIGNLYMPMTTRFVSDGANRKIFCKIAIREPWLCKALSGHKHRSGDCQTGRLALLVQLAEAVRKAWMGHPGESVVADGAAHLDPMNMINAGDDEVGAEPGAKRRRGAVAVARRSKANRN